MPGTAAPSRRRTSSRSGPAHPFDRRRRTHRIARRRRHAVVASTAATGTTRERLRLLGWRAWLFVAALICAPLPGVLGHDPWKQDETYTFGIIQHMLETGDFVVPTNAGLPFMENRRSTRGSRPASPGCCSASCRCTTRPGSRARCSPHWHSASSRARRVASRADAWLDLRVIGPVVLSAGTLVVIKHVHDMMTDVALFAGTAIAFCGLLELVMQHVTRAQQMRHGLPVRPSGRWAAPIFGAGVGIALMTKGLFVPLVFAATLVGALVLYPACRTRAFARSLGIAALVFAPFALVWPTALFLRSETLFMTWFWDNNVGRFFGFSVPNWARKRQAVLHPACVPARRLPVAPLAIVARVRGATGAHRASRCR